MSTHVELDVPAPADHRSASSGWRSYLPGTNDGKLPWGWRWLGLPLLLALCTLSGWWSWDHMEDQLDTRALVHLECENIDTSGLALDWSYRSVTVDGQLPDGITTDQVEQVIDSGSDNTACLAQAGIDAADDPGVYDVKMLAAAGVATAAVLDDETAAAPDPAPTARPAPTVAPTQEPTAEAEPAEEPETIEAPAAPARLDATAAFDGEAFTLTGTVASEAQRQTLVDVAARTFGAANVIDELQVGEGEATVDSDLRAAELATLISQLDPNLVSEGRATVNDQSLTYALVSPTNEARDGLALPGSGTIEVRRADDDASAADSDTDADNGSAVDADSGTDTDAGADVETHATPEFTG